MNKIKVAHYHKSDKCAKAHPCPWLRFNGNAGTLEYATNVYEWMEHELGFGQFCICCDSDWWYVEERSPVSTLDSRSTPTEEKQNPSVAPLVEATFNDTAKNLAQMVTNYVESGIKGGTDWRNGLAIIIALRLKRIQMSKPSLAQAGQEPPKD